MDYGKTIFGVTSIEVSIANPNHHCQFIHLPRINHGQITTHSIRVWYIYLHLPKKMTETQPNGGKYTIHGCYVQELM